MPPVLIGIAAVGAAGAAVAGAITWTTALVIASVAMAAGSLLNQPKVPGGGTSPQERKQVIRAAASPMVGVVGNDQLSGVLTFAEENKSNDELNLTIALAGNAQPAGEPVIHSVNKVLMDDEEIPLGSSHDGKVFVRVYDGSQSSISDLGSELKNLPSWRNDMIGKGICFAHVRVRFDQELFPSGLPNFVFELDTLGEVSLSSDAILNYLQSNFGAKPDEIDLESFDIARAICEEEIGNGDGGEECRYTCNGAYNFDESHKQIIDKMLITCAGQLTYINGKFGLRVGAYNGPADFVLTEDDLAGDINIKPQPDRRSLINTCKGKHVWPEAKFQEVDFPKIHSEEMLEEDGEELEKDLNLEFCHSPYQCQRLAANDIARARLPVITAPCNMRAFECYLGRNITIDWPSVGYVNKECVVEGWELNPEKGVTLTLREDSPEVWTDIVGKVPMLPPDVTLPNPKDCSPVEDIELTELAVDGLWESRITWAHPHPASIYKYRLLLEKMDGTDSEWIEKHNGELSSPFFVMTNPEPGAYRVEVKAVNRFDVSSSPVQQPLTVNTPELTVSNMAAEVDNAVYPASAMVIAEVTGAEAFPAGSVVYETETRTGSSDWLPVGKGSSPSVRLSGLDDGQHWVRMRAVPPYGTASRWRQLSFSVFVAEQPSDLIFVDDLTFDRWGQITWQGAGQSWEVEVRTVNAKSETSIAWSDSVTEPSIWLDWLKPAQYQICVRARAGSVISEWAQLSVAINTIPAPHNLVFDTDAASPGSTGTLHWQTGDNRPQQFDVEVVSDGARIYASPSYVLNEPLPVLLPGSYQFRVRARWRNEVSGWASIGFGYQLAPADITGLQLRALGNQAMLSWDKPGDDVYGSGFVQVRHTPKAGDNISWETASPLTDRLTGNTTMVQVPLLTGTYLVKAVNGTGLWSENAAKVFTNMADSIGYNRIVERAEPADWPGTRNKATVSGASLTLKESAVNNEPPSYIMEQPLDLNGVFTVRLQMECDGSVYASDLIDERLDPIDDWPLFDGDDPGNTSLQYFVSQTDDDPASPTAQWSEWTQFLLGEFRARAFRLKVRLVTAPDNFAAAGTITGLRLVADVPDRQERQNDMQVPAAGLPVQYATAFMAPAELFITGHNLASGDYYKISHSTAQGFTIQWFNSAGNAVARSCNWLAISYGEQQ